MTYLKVFTDFAMDLEPLSDAECGRLFKAMLLYAETGMESSLIGNERFLWGTAKRNIDKQRETYEVKARSMAKAREQNTNNNRSLLNSKEQFSVEEKEKDKDKEKDKEKKKKDITMSDDIVCTSDEARIVELWNSLGLSKVYKIVNDSNRDKQLKKRLRDYGIDSIFTAIENVRCSDFLKGDNKNGWVITFDWFISPQNFAKVLEGNYDDRPASFNTGNGTRNTKAQELDDFYKMAAKWSES